MIVFEDTEVVGINVMINVCLLCFFPPSFSLVSFVWESFGIKYEKEKNNC